MQLGSQEADTPPPSVEELQARLNSNPTDMSAKVDLAEALLNRHSYKATQHDLQHLREIVAELDEDAALYYRPYLAYWNNEDLSSYLVQYLRWCKQKDQTPLNSAELFDYYSAYPRSQALCLHFAEAIAAVWPQSAAEWTMRGLAEFYAEEPDTEKAMDSFVRALNEDKHYWYAALFCGHIYRNHEIWASARNYYLQALQYEFSEALGYFGLLASTYASLAWCSAKLKDYPSEEKYYRACLEADPNYGYAWNNLGWSLRKQGRYEEALGIFEESIRHGKDGEYPLRNKAGVLIKLKRLPEAIEALRLLTTRTGRIERWAQEEIDRIQEAMARSEPMVALPAPIDDLEDSGGTSPPGMLPPVKGKGVASISTPHSATPSEKSLEAMLEEKIVKEGCAFGRRLRMYNPPGGSYGRQLRFVEADRQVRRIDLLLEDVDKNELIVVELKQKQSDDQVVGQILSYMTWVRQNLAQGRNVCGIICVNKATESIKRSASQVPGLTVQEYSFTFNQV